MGDRDRNELALIYSNAFEEVKNNREELVPPYSKWIGKEPYPLMGTFGLTSQELDSSRND
jgi:hypothetical protein